jgi:hypothetical protein
MRPDPGDVRRVADAVLYEGYLLYPYRASAQKNRSRWQFGVLMPSSYVAADPSESSGVRAECVFTRSGDYRVEVLARFLQVQRRTGPGSEAWDEAVEHEVAVCAGGEQLPGDDAVMPFEVPGGEERSGDDVVRRRRALAGSVTVRATAVPGPWQAMRLTVEVTNRTDCGPDVPSRREDALPYALVAAHMIITVPGGAFVSMTDPPEWAAAAVGECENVGCWPVLAGPPGTTGPSGQVVLASPIILPDHPELAPESPGELYDGTEIDEILTLRTLALTDAEKDAARATDPRAAALIDRVESLSRDGPALERLHGTFREPDPPDPPDQAVVVAGRRIARGSRVTLRPGGVSRAGGVSGAGGASGAGLRRTDAQDMFLAGRAAVVEAILIDVEDTPYLAVSLADDPAADLHAAHGRFLYFGPDEVEPS